MRLAVLLLIALLAGSLRAAEKPNVILFLIDDMGYECIAANGCTSYKTPVIDSLAAEGMRFTQCHVQPLCTPTRVQLMTGIFNIRNYTDFGQMDRKAVTFANLLKGAGYATCMAGKWQLGADLDQPKNYGFDEHCLWQHTRRPGRYPNPGLEINGVEKDYNNGEYGPDVVTDYALDFIARNKDKSFFLYNTQMLTHGPYMATPESKDWNPKLTGEKGGGKNDAEHFRDMVQHTDMIMGRIVAKLDALGIRKNTLILIIGDNGTGKGTRTMMGDKLVIGGKGDTTRFGSHVPMIVSWPAILKPGKVCDDLISSVDFLPTIAQAAGVSVTHAIDGVSFLPQLRGEAGSPRPWLYHWYDPRANNLREWAFDHQYKLYTTGNLYDWQADPNEKSPLDPAHLSPAAAAAKAKLQAAIDQYKNARPAELKKSEDAKIADKKDKKKGKNKGQN